MRILVDKALKHFYMLCESLILCKHIIVPGIKEKQNFKLFTL